MSCGGGYSGGCGGGSISDLFSSGGCGGSSSISIPLGSGGCGGSSGSLHISRGACGDAIITVDSGGCGGTVPASNNDIVRAIEHIRSNRNI